MIIIIVFAKKVNKQVHKIRVGTILQVDQKKVLKQTGTTLNHRKSIKTVTVVPIVHFLFGMTCTVGMQQFQLIYCHGSVNMLHWALI